MRASGIPLLAGVLAVGAVVFAFVPFTETRATPFDLPDHLNVSCGAPVVAAVHGKAVAKVAGTWRVLTQYERSVTSRQNPHATSIMCRRPARGRVLLSVVGLCAAIALAVAYGRRRLDDEITEEDAAIPT